MCDSARQVCVIFVTCDSWFFFPTLGKNLTQGRGDCDRILYARQVCVYFRRTHHCSRQSWGAHLCVSRAQGLFLFFSVYQNWMYVCGIMCLRQFRGAYFGHSHFFSFVLQHDLPWFVCVVACVGEWVHRWVGGVGGWFGCIVWAFPFAVLIIENCARTLTHTRTHKHTRIQVLACICIWFLDIKKNSIHMFAIWRSHVCACVCIYVCVCLCVCVCVCVCVCLSVSVFKCVGAYVWALLVLASVNLCVDVCMYACTYTYTHIQSAHLIMSRKSRSHTFI